MEKWLQLKKTETENKIMRQNLLKSRRQITILLHYFDYV